MKVVAAQLSVFISGDEYYLGQNDFRFDVVQI